MMAREMNKHYRASGKVAAVRRMEISAAANEVVVLARMILSGGMPRS